MIDPLHDVAAQLPDLKVAPESTEDEAGQVDEMRRHVLEHAVPAVPPRAHQVGGGPVAVEHANSIDATHAAAVEMTLERPDVGPEPEVVRRVPHSPALPRTPGQIRRDFEIEDQRLLDEDVFAEIQEILEQLHLDVVGHGQDGRLVAGRVTLGSRTVVRRGIERIDRGHAPLAQDRLPFGPDVAVPDEEVPHRYRARRSRPSIFCSTSMGVMRSKSVKSRLFPQRFDTWLSAIFNRPAGICPTMWGIDSRLKIPWRKSLRMTTSARCEWTSSPIRRRVLSLMGRLSTRST